MFFVRTYLFLIILLAGLSVSAQSDQVQYNGHIKFRTRQHNFGKLPKSNPVKKVVFLFENNGNEPLLLYHITPFCGCISYTYTKTPVEPGKSGHVSLIFDGTQKSEGMFEQSVIVDSSSHPDTRVYLVVKGEIIDVKPHNGL